MGCGGGCNTISKILCAVASAFVLAGIIVLIVTFTKAPAVETVVSGQSDFTLDLNDPAHCGYGLYADAALDCGAVALGIHVTDPHGHVRTFFDEGILPICSDPQPDSWESKHDPKLKVVSIVGHATESDAKVLGSYRVVSDVAPLWAMDYCSQVKSGIEALLEMLGLLILGIALIVVGLIVSCVSCCSMGLPAEKEIVINQQVLPQAVGTPVRTAAW